jgi:adenine-specific DNA methylase
MPKRLIEVALPLKEVSEQSAREKSIRHGHISTLHIWWARRPLAACRAAVFASLIPDPDDPECPEDFRRLVREVLGRRSEFRPKSEADGSTVADTPRNRCLEFIKQLVRWENSNNPEYIEPARRLIAAAHKILHPGAEGDAPKVLDPFAGGGAIPLEALRLGCEAQASDINPVAHLIELCTLVYPQAYGQPNSRPVPNYIKKLAVHNRAKKKVDSGASLFKKEEPAGSADRDEVIPDVAITEGEYRKNPLAAEFRYWGNWVLESSRREIHRYYPHESGGGIPAAYLWARTVRCPNPSCGATLPLLRQLWLCNKPKRKVALRIEEDSTTKRYAYAVSVGNQIDYDPSHGTIRRGNAVCLFCQQTASVSYLRQESRAGRMGHEMTCVVTGMPGESGKTYRPPTESDFAAFRAAENRLSAERNDALGKLIPSEPISKRQPRLMWITTYGVERWDQIFNARQLIVLAVLARQIHHAIEQIKEKVDLELAVPLGGLLSMAFDRTAESNTTIGRWIPPGEKPAGAYARQGLPMVWDYCEVNLLEESPRQFADSLDWVHKCIVHLSLVGDRCSHITRSSVTALPLADSSIEAIVTDPPYYDAVPYSDLSDFFYVWLKRTMGSVLPELFRTPLSPKRQELIEERAHTSITDRKDKSFYERGMAAAFGEMHRVLGDSGICCVMFAHKTTSAWETLIAGLLDGSMTVTASWPLHTERPGRMIALGTAALASSVTLVCRKRDSRFGDGIWDDVRRHLQKVAKERLDFFWSEGIRGADFFISAIGRPYPCSASTSE